MKANPLLSLRNIYKSYPIGGQSTLVLNNVSLTVNSGELLAIVGASGSGKSTLMNIIGLLDKADEGNYLLNCLDVANLNDEKLASLRNQSIGFVFQQFNLLSRFTAKQNVALPLIYRHVSAPEIEERVHQALACVHMQAFLNHRPTQLSGGQQQRIAIARALIGDPQVILADEPTGALDSQTSNEVMKLFLSLHEAGRTIILITHDKEIAAQCSRQITLADGQIISEKSS